MDIIKFDELYEELLCEDAPITTDDDKTVDPWDGVKPYAEDGFYVKYCTDYRKATSDE